MADMTKPTAPRRCVGCAKQHTSGHALCEKCLTFLTPGSAMRQEPAAPVQPEPAPEPSVAPEVEEAQAAREGVQPLFEQRVLVEQGTVAPPREPLCPVCEVALRTNLTIWKSRTCEVYACGFARTYHIADHVWHQDSPCSSLEEPAAADPVIDPAMWDAVTRTLRKVAEILKNAMETDRASITPMTFETANERLGFFRVAVHKAVDVLLYGTD